MRKHLKTEIICLVVLFQFFLFVFQVYSNESPQTTDSKVHFSELPKIPLKHMEMETGFYYTIQKGDTLWDLSNRFFDSPYFWPALWGENNQILNPHWIYPGQRIQLFHKKDTKNFKDHQEAAAKAPDLKKPEPTATKEQDSGLSLQPSQDENVPSSITYSSMEKIGFVREYPAESQGSIFEVVDKKKMISNRDLVYIKVNGDEPLVVGTRYYIFRTFDPLTQKDSEKQIGIQHLIVGVLEIIKTIPQFSVGEVVKSFHAIAKNDQILPYSPRSTKITLKKGVPGLEGEILLSENHAKIMSSDMIAFINKGAENGIEIGQTYRLYYTDQIFRPNEKYFLPTHIPEDIMPIDFGTFIVLHTERTTATVLVLKTTRSFRKGTKFHASL